MSTSLDQQSEPEATKPSTASATSTPAGEGVAPSQQPNETSNATVPPKNASVCGVCNINPPKYKCPRCYLPYCSVACNKTHRENHPADPDPDPTSAPNSEPKLDTKPASDAQFNAPPPPSSSGQRNPFRALDTSEQLRRLFQKYPSLPDQLLQIHAATLPPAASASQNPGIPPSLLKGLPKKETWNHDIGIQNGKEALRRARRADGEAGEAIREYTELILHLMNTQDPDADVTNLLRQQLAEEDTKLIERLMAEEK